MSIWNRHGTDLDNILEPRQGGDPGMSATGHTDGSNDMADLYAPADVGEPYSNVLGYETNDTDLGSSFCALGTRAEVDTRNIYCESQAATNNGIRWNETYSILDNSWVSSPGRVGCRGGPESTSNFDWLITGDRGEFEIRFSLDSGDLQNESDSMNTWLSLGNTRILETTSGATGTYSIRRNGIMLGSGNWEIGE